MAANLSAHSPEQEQGRTRRDVLTATGGALAFVAVPAVAVSIAERGGVPVPVGDDPLWLAYCDADRRACDLYFAVEDELATEAEWKAASDEADRLAEEIASAPTGHRGGLLRARFLAKEMVHGSGQHDLEIVRQLVADLEALAGARL